MKNKNLLVLGIVFICVMFCIFPQQNENGGKCLDCSCSCCKTVFSQQYKIGDKGPGGGIVFQISEDGKSGYEVSDVLGEDFWENAKKICENYKGGGFSDWYLPSIEELRLIYLNLRRSRKISDDNMYWSSQEYWSGKGNMMCLDFSNGDLKGRHSTSFLFSFRAIRAF